MGSAHATKPAVCSILLSVMTELSFREPAMLGRTGRSATDQSEWDRNVSP